MSVTVYGGTSQGNMAGDNVGSQIKCDGSSSILMQGNDTYMVADNANGIVVKNGGSVAVHGNGAVIQGGPSGSSITVDGGTLSSTMTTFGTNVGIWVSFSSHIGVLLVHGSLIQNCPTANGKLYVGDGTASGNLTVGAAGSLTVGDHVFLTVRGALNFDSATLDIEQSAIIVVHNGSLLPYFTFVPTSLSVAFTDHTYADGSGGAIATWAWDFGDSFTSPLQNPVHVYAGSGTYTVVLTTTDADGNSSTCSIDVTV